MKGKVGIRMSRVTSFDAEFMGIEIIDEASYVSVVRIDISLEDFARCISGVSLMDIPAEFGNLLKVGQQMEVKTIDIPGLDLQTWKKRSVFVKQYEVDGWIADKEDGWNHHRSTKDGYKVHFRRWV
jgi:hypothetical protein